MKKTSRYGSLLFLTLTLCLFACEKEELPINKHNRGDLTESMASMGDDYRYQLFFDLETNSMVMQNMKTDWDLGFETSAARYGVILNTAKAMFAASTFETDFSLVTDTVGLIFHWDEASGNMDSTAIGDWTLSNNVYVLDRGYNELGVHLGLKKVIFQSVNSQEYSIRCANMDGTNDISYVVPKDDNYNFTFLSLDGISNAVSIEPPKEDWDISFTQYTHVFYGQGPAMPYLVSGVLINRNGVEVTRIFDKEFAEITLDDAYNYSFLPAINAIGYDWKAYDFGTGLYTVFSNQNYIVKSTEGKYFKLHFIDFYDDSGSKGSPTFEFQEL